MLDQSNIANPGRVSQPRLTRSRWRALRVFWYERGRPVWLDVRPVVLALATIAVLVLGTIGFQQWEHAHDEHPEVLDSFYRTMTLFELDGTDTQPPIPWPMEVARFLAPLLVGYAVFRALLAVFRNQIQLAGVRVLTRNHVVVAGLGSMGFRLASAFRAEGFRVIVIEIDEANRRIQSCAARGITVLNGDARDRRMLARARIAHARYLIVVCGDDGRNVEVSVAAQEAASGRPAGVLHALVHLQDAGIWRMLKAEAVARAGSQSIRVEYFNAFETGARMLLDERPPFAAVATPSAPRRPHVVIAGVEGIGEALILNTARLWQNSDPAADEDLRLTILDEDAERWRTRLVARYPELETICDLRASPSWLGVELQRGPLGIDLEPRHPITSVYVCIAEQARALEVTLALRARRELQGADFAVALSDAEAGLARVLHDDSETGVGVYRFGVLNRALAVEPLIRGTNEALARAKHEEYVRDQLARGVAMGEGLMVPWEQLDEEWKDANRAFADGIGAHLETVHGIVVPSPLIDPAGELFSFTDDEVERLARLEHERWSADKMRNGWRYGPVRDDADKVHPLLVDWEQLPEIERDKDREPVREVPAMLAHAGLEVLRAGGAQEASPAPAHQGQVGQVF